MALVFSMATVYERIQIFEKSHWFRFNQKHKMFVGAAIKRHWNQTDASIQDPLIFVITEEPEGTFSVAFYPDYFTSYIDSIIADYVLRMTTKKKKSTEKPPKPKLSKTESSVPPQNSLFTPPGAVKKRKRIPIQQPAYTTRKK